MLLSIVIPAYNAERFIEKTLLLLISQGLTETEVIVINDGSKDKTRQIVENISKNNSAIKLINQENKGESYTEIVAFKQLQVNIFIFLIATTL